MMICPTSPCPFLAFICASLILSVRAKSGNLLLRKRGGGEYQITSKNCSGVFFKAAIAIEYECACVNGVWAFYEQFCGEPALVVGGNNYCFSLSGLNTAHIGSYRDAFEPSISHFQKENFALMTTTIAESEYNEYNRLELDAMGSWITVTNTQWTLFGPDGESICLQPTVPGQRVICTYNEGWFEAIHTTSWNTIIHVQKGCHSNETVKADACYPIRRPNEKLTCLPPITTSCPDPENKTDTNPPDPYCNSILKLTTPTPPPTTSTTTTAKPLCGELSRELVKQYWLDPANNQCAKSLNEAILTDQLRRFATTRFDKIFESRLQSLDQMRQIVTHSRDIIKKTCNNDYVPSEFFDVATDAFLMFINEDFFYGVEGVDQLSFERVLKTLKTCWKRAKLFVYESKPLGCDLRKITGKLILPGEKADVTIPENMKSKHFEPLIETAWKIFLNAHSYCYEDFMIPNDHHHFSVLFIELFSKAIYEKWIEPLTSRELYKFIVPKFDVMKEIMENMDYCVAATGQISECPVWMTRSNPEAKPILDSTDLAPNSKTAIDIGDIPYSRRKKRSTWVRGVFSERVNIWDGEAYCTQNMVDPSRLGLATCAEAF